MLEPAEKQRRSLPSKIGMASPELIVIFPVFNEQDAIQNVVCEWMKEIETLVDHFVML